MWNRDRKIHSRDCPGKRVMTMANRQSRESCLTVVQSRHQMVVGLPDSCSAQVVSTFLDTAGNSAAASCAGFTGWAEPSTPISSICHFLPQHSSQEGSLLSSLHRQGDQGSERWLCCSPSHREVVVDPEFKLHSLS